MSLPPQLIGIKRRRHDEPVDVLCKGLADAHHFAANENTQTLNKTAPRTNVALPTLSSSA